MQLVPVFLLIITNDNLDTLCGLLTDGRSAVWPFERKDRASLL